eukprot:760604-Hanusia_phi.AAC.1
MTCHLLPQALGSASQNPASFSSFASPGATTFGEFPPPPPPSPPVRLLELEGEDSLAAAYSSRAVSTSISPRPCLPCPFQPPSSHLFPLLLLLSSPHRYDAGGGTSFGGFASSGAGASFTAAASMQGSPGMAFGGANTSFGSSTPKAPVRPQQPLLLVLTHRRTILVCSDGRERGHCSHCQGLVVARGMEEAARAGVCGGMRMRILGSHFCCSHLTSSKASSSQYPLTSLPWPFRPSLLPHPLLIGSMWSRRHQHAAC